MLKDKKKKKNLLMKSNMNLPQFLNDEFFVKYETFLELAKVRISDVYFGGLKTF